MAAVTVTRTAGSLFAVLVALVVSGAASAADPPATPSSGGPSSVVPWDMKKETWLQYGKRNITEKVDYERFGTARQLGDKSYMSLLRYQSWGYYQTIQYRVSGGRSNAANEKEAMASVSKVYDSDKVDADIKTLRGMFRPAPCDMVVWTCSGGQRYPEGFVSTTLAKSYADLIHKQTPGRAAPQRLLILKGEPCIIINNTRPAPAHFEFQHEVLLPEGAAKRFGLVAGLEDLTPEERLEKTRQRGVSDRIALPMLDDKELEAAKKELEELSRAGDKKPDKSGLDTGARRIGLDPDVRKPGLDKDKDRELDLDKLRRGIDVDTRPKGLDTGRRPPPGTDKDVTPRPDPKPPKP
jgi:hypothetical protein